MKESSLNCLEKAAYGEEEMARQTILQQLGDINEDLPYEIFIETVAQAPIAISITDRKANILYVNRAFSEVTGYLPEEAIGKNQSLLSNKNTPRAVYKKLWSTISKKKCWQGRLVNRHGSGRPYLADLTIAPMLDKNGNISHYIGMLRDITANYEAEQRLKNHKQLIESVINLLPVAVAVIDCENRVVLDNHSYKALISDLGIDEPADHFLGLIREEMGDAWSKLQENGQSFDHREYRIDRTPKSARWFSCAGAFFYENAIHADNFFNPKQGRYLILTLTDITRQRRQVEHSHIQNLKLMIAEDEQVRTIRETLLGAMHQIQVPMNQIKAAEQILQFRQDEQNKGLLDILQQIQQSGTEALENMQGCLPEIPQSAVIPVNLNQLLHESLLLSEQKIRSFGIDIVWKPESRLPPVLGSENRLRILFKQLLDNAIEAMEAARIKDMELTLTTARGGNGLVHVCIADNGHGIPEDKHMKVFEPFYTTRHKGGSQAGTGLAMTKEIMTQHQGLIEIDTAYQRGCRFKLSFPVYDKAYEEGMT